MNIYALKGHIVKVTVDAEGKVVNGESNDKKLIEEHLEVGKEYIVDHTRVHSWSTEVYLRGFPGISFNSVNFESVSEQTNGQDACHDDYEKYN